MGFRARPFLIVLAAVILGALPVACAPAPTGSPSATSTPPPSSPASVLRSILVLPEPSAPATGPTSPAGISREQAIRLAVDSLPPRSVETILRASEAPFVRFGEAAAFAPGDRWVWRVIARGRFEAASCGPVGSDGRPPSPCPIVLQFATVYLDHATGEWLGAGYSGVLP